MKKIILKISVFFLLMCFATIYSYYLTNLYSLDEIWNYGFAKNILDGLIPYKDFNMIIPPLFPYITSFVLKIFGQKLLVYHIFIALLVTCITYLASRKIGFYSILIYISLLIYSSNGYNINTLFLLFILLTVLEKKLRYQDIIIPMLVSLMILSKQTLVLFAIPSIIYSKQKKKTLSVYFIFFFSFLIYLFYYDNLIQFLDYCFLGMFEFTEKNNLSIPVYLMVECIACLSLVLSLWQSRGQRKDILYVLLYQIIVFPIVDISHFVLGWSAILYLLFQKEGFSQFIRNSMFVIILTLELAVLLISNYTTTFLARNYLEHSRQNTFLKGRLIPNVTNIYIDEISDKLMEYNDYQVYILGGNSYLIKLSLDIPINKYDLINYGNMGYRGEDKYIAEIRKKCREQKCLFILSNHDLTTNKYNQTSYKILSYIDKNYSKIHATNIYGVYIN